MKEELALPHRSPPLHQVRRRWVRGRSRHGGGRPRRRPHQTTHPAIDHR
jgi:hypothetical protein